MEEETAMRRVWRILDASLNFAGLRQASVSLLISLVFLTACDQPEARPQVLPPNQLSLATVSNMIERGMSFQVLTQRLGSPPDLERLDEGEFVFSYDFSETSLSPDKTEEAIGVFVSVVSNRVDELMVIWKPVGSRDETAALLAHEPGSAESSFSKFRNSNIKMWILFENGDPRNQFQHRMVEGTWHTNQSPDLASESSSLRFETTVQGVAGAIHAQIDLDQESRVTFSDLVGEHHGRIVVIAVDGHLIGAGRLLSPVNAGRLVLPVPTEALDSDSKKWIDDFLNDH
jgi:hypothetical protein